MTIPADKLFNIEGKCVAVTGGTGVLCGAMARELAVRGAKVCLVVRDPAKGAEAVKEIAAAGGEAFFVQADVLDKGQLEQALAGAVARLGRIDVLINGAGGNRKDATVNPTTPFFDLPADALRGVFDLNCLGTMLPCQVFGKHMAQQGAGVIINISSMAAFRPLTNIAGYSAAKAAVSNFTQWLATYMAMNVSPNIRVNAIAPGFFITHQNRAMLTDVATGQPTPRGQSVLAHTPMKRFGEAADLLGALVWLVSDSAKFVTGVVVPVDGGFAAFAGV
jgi:NAD(P)-dependent dehydrogenase (short-subunit alcohol dehydrogenase family)